MVKQYNHYIFVETKQNTMKTILVENEKTHYFAAGSVYGLDWGNGEGSYSSVGIRANTMEDLEKQIWEGIENNNLDDGFGFQKILGCQMIVTKFETLTIDGKDYVNEQQEQKLYGDMQPHQVVHLMSHMFE